MIWNYLNGDIRYYLGAPWYWFRDLFQDLKAFIQRGSRGYADSDIWDLDQYLVDWLPGALRHLKEMDIGHPSSLKEKQWDKILLTMASGFESNKSEKQKEALELFTKWFFALWW